VSKSGNRDRFHIPNDTDLTGQSRFHADEKVHESSDSLARFGIRGRGNQPFSIFGVRIPSDIRPQNNHLGGRRFRPRSETRRQQPQIAAINRRGFIAPGQRAVFDVENNFAITKRPIAFESVQQIVPIDGAFGGPMQH